MTTLEAFRLESPADLGPFADALEEQGFRRWAESVRWLIANNRWLTACAFER